MHNFLTYNDEHNNLPMILSSAMLSVIYCRLHLSLLWKFIVNCWPVVNRWLV